MTCEWWQRQDAEPKCEFFPYIFIYPYNQPTRCAVGTGALLVIYVLMFSLRIRNLVPTKGLPEQAGWY